MNKYNEKEIVTDYLSGNTALSIAKKLNTYNSTIRRILIRNKIKLRGNTGIQSFVNPEVFFDNSEQANYWIGFLAADGYIGDKEYAVEISTSEKDKEHLRKFAEFTNSKLHCYMHKRYKVPQYRVKFRNKSVNLYLKSIGVTERKSRNIKLLIPFNFNILRGIIDGDGCIIILSPTRVSVQIASASKEFLEQIREFLSENDINIASITKVNDIFSLNIFKKA